MAWLTPARRATAKRIAAYFPVVILVVGVIALWQMVREFRPQLRDASFKFSWSLLALASVLWLGTYIQLVQMWGRSLVWWDSQPLRLFRSLRTFFLANLARYIPGAVWQFAGLSTLAAAEGTSPTAASMGLILMQIATLATGIAMTLSAAPGFVANWTHGLGVVGQVTIAVVLIAALIAGFPLVLPPLRTWAEKRFKRSIPIPVPPQGPFAIYVLRAASSWVTYSLAFWVFSVALLGNGAPPAWTAMTAYLASYLIGLLVIIAPGGLIVREGSLVLCLAPSVGREAAVILAISSRLWLVGMELGATAVVVGLDYLLHHRHRTASTKSRASARHR